MSVQLRIEPVLKCIDFYKVDHVYVVSTFVSELGHLFTHIKTPPKPMENSNFSRLISFDLKDLTRKQSQRSFVAKTIEINSTGTVAALMDSEEVQLWDLQRNCKIKYVSVKGERILYLKWISIDKILAITKQAVYEIKTDEDSEGAQCKVKFNENSNHPPFGTSPNSSRIVDMAVDKNLKWLAITAIEPATRERPNNRNYQMQLFDLDNSTLINSYQASCASFFQIDNKNFIAMTKNDETNETGGTLFIFNLETMEAHQLALEFAFLAKQKHRDSIMDIYVREKKITKKKNPP